MPFNPCPTIRRRDDDAGDGEGRSREGSHFEDHAVLGRISESRHPRLTGSALPLSPKHEPCPNHPRHPVLLDKALFAQKTRHQKANDDAAADPAVDGDGNANVGDNAGGNATADAHPAFRSVEHLHRSPSKRLSHFSLRSLPSRLFKRREREKIDFHRLYTETSAVEIQRMQEEMSHQIKAMEEESRKVSLTIKNKDKDDRSGSHFEAYTKREWSKESKESANGDDNAVEHDNADASAKATAKQKEKVDIKGKKRETSGSQSQPSAVLPDSTWKSLGAAINRTPSRKLTEAVPDRTISTAGAVAAAHTPATSTPPKKDNQPSNATVIASARASGVASQSEHTPAVPDESRSSRADKDDKILSGKDKSPEKDKSEKRSRSRKSRNKEPSNPFLTQSGNQIEDPIVEPSTRLSINEAEQAKTTDSQIEPTSRKTSPAEVAQPESDSRKGKHSKKEKKRMKGSITEQLASLPFGEKPHEDTISVSRAMTESEKGIDKPKSGVNTPKKAPSRKVSLQAAKWESIMRMEKESSGASSPIRIVSRGEVTKTTVEDKKKVEKKVYIPPHQRAQKQQDPFEDILSTPVEPEQKDVSELPKTSDVDESHEEVGDEISKSNQQQPPVAPGVSEHEQVEILSEIANDVSNNVEKMRGTTDTDTDVDVEEVEVEDDEGESVHVGMGERLRVRKNRVASGLDKVFKGLQKRALSAARAHNAQLQALLGQEKKKDSDQQKEEGVAEEVQSQEGNYAWLTDVRRKGFGYKFVDEEQRADTAEEGDAPAGVDEADAAGNDSDKENAGPVFYTPIPPQERERPEVPSYSWPGRSGATEDSTGAEADVATTAGVSADGETEHQDEKKPDEKKRWFSVGNGSFRKLVSGKMSDVIRASPSSIQRALSNTSLAPSMLTTLSDQVQGDLPAPNHSVKSRSASIHTRKSNKSNISLPSLAEQTQADPVYSPPPRICSPEETKFLASNGVYSFGEDLERQLSNINLSDSEAVPSKPDDASPRPRTPTKYTMDPTDTGAHGGALAGPRYRTPLGAGLNATAILRPNPNPGSRAPGGVRSRTGSGTNSSSHVDDRRDGAGTNTSSLYPPALHPRSRRSSSPKPPPPYAVAVGGGADGKRDIAMNQGPDVRGSTAAFRERQVADGMTVKEQLLKLVDSTWPDEQ